MSATDESPLPRAGDSPPAMVTEAQVHASLLRSVAFALTLTPTDGVAHLERLAAALERIK